MTGSRGCTLAIVQARTSSTRLPGKVLKPLAGAPMILRQLERVSRAGTLDGVVVATSDDASDNDLAVLLTNAGYDIVRGPLEDVLARFTDVLDRYQPDVVVRITADCPLISPTVIDLVVEQFHASVADYVSNTLQPTYPDGLDVEVTTAEALRTVASVSTDRHEREHVTLGLYRHPEKFIVENVVDPSGNDNSSMRWTVDNPGDFSFVSTIYEHLYPHHFDYDDVLDLLKSQPELNRTDANAPRNAALEGLATGAMSNPTAQDHP